MLDDKQQLNNSTVTNDSNFEDEFLSEVDNNKEIDTEINLEENKITKIKNENEIENNNENNSENIREEKNEHKKFVKEPNPFVEPTENINFSSGLKITSDDKEEELAKKIKEIDLTRKENEIKSQAVAQGYEYIDLKGLPIVPEALSIISEEHAKQYGVICFMYQKDRQMRLAILKDDEKTQTFISGLKAEYNIEVKVFLTSKNSFDNAFKLYAALPKIIEHPDDVKILESDLEKSVGELNDLSELKDKIDQISMTEVFSLILAAAIKIEASDIHIEAEEEGIELRFRIDGVLHKVAKLNKESWEHLISRIKLNSKLKINVKDKPQDGRFSVRINGQPLDFRVSTLPTAFGESVVMRILYHDKVKNMSLDKLGIEGYNKEIIDAEIKKPNGMVVITGPTGSGKTTTLYAILNKLNTTDNKIITIEDPIEYKIAGINQSEINKDKGYTFAKALRSVVRQDPDIILVGEIRDQETAEISLNAALTGHLVFSTLHTNDAAGAIPRFLSLGGKPYLLAPAINVSVAQRLVRKVCQHCKQEETLNEETKEMVRKEIESLPESYKNKIDIDINNLKFYKGKGCKQCAGLGYKGQLGIFEALVITDEIRDSILANNVSEHQLNELARKNGMITMRQDGILKATQGITSLAEVFRVT